MSLFGIGLAAVERGWIPDSITRRVIRRLCSQRIRLESRQVARDLHDTDSKATRFTDSMRHGPIAPVPQSANDQHYELPSEFFDLILGSRRKYSCCVWSKPASTLDEAEVDALRISCQRADIADGQQILELGSGWGSLALWIAENYPRSRVITVSNSSSQREYIERLVMQKSLQNLHVITADINDFDPSKLGTLFGKNLSHNLGRIANPCYFRGCGIGSKFDRIISIEMFEHLRNYELMLHRIASWLADDGKLFVHIFCHRDLVYPFETDGAANWMGRNFFTGGIMPSADLLPRFNRDLKVVQQWKWNGRHYQRTADAWLANLDANREAVVPILQRVYGASHAVLWLQRWRMFFLACSELFGYAQGDEWFVSHYLLEQCRH